MLNIVKILIFLCVFLYSVAATSYPSKMFTMFEPSVELERDVYITKAQKALQENRTSDFVALIRECITDEERFVSSNNTPWLHCYELAKPLFKDLSPSIWQQVDLMMGASASY